MRPGLVDLRDLGHVASWQRASAPLVDALGVEPEAASTWRGFAPPPALVVVVPYDQPELVQRSARWIADASAVLVVRDRRDGSEDREAAWRAVAYPQIDWAGDVEPVRAAIAALPVADRARVDMPILELPPSSWIPIAGGAWIARSLRHDGARALLGDHDLAALPVAIELAAVPEPEVTGFLGRRWIGADPSHAIDWIGDHDFLDWTYHGGYLDSLGHEAFGERMQNARAQNHPRRVALSADGEWFVAVYAHDAMIGESPIRWTRAGANDVALWPQDRRRAYLHVDSHPMSGWPVSPDPDDDDPMCSPPEIVLGPDEAHRYAVDLADEVWRIVPGGAGGSLEPTDGFAVFDADHRLVRRGIGRLRAGWGAWIIVEHEARYWREHVATGERVPLGASLARRCLDPQIEAIALDAVRAGRHADAERIRAEHETHAVGGPIGYLAVPGTTNVLAIAAGFVRVI